MGEEASWRDEWEDIGWGKMSRTFSYSLAHSSRITAVLIMLY
jgi:hypothetical protein